MEGSKSVNQNIDAAKTLFTVSGTNQLRQIAMADNKAIMITAICSGIIFLVVALFSSGFSLEGSPLLENLQFALPMSIMLAFCFISIIFAVLALKPKIVRTKKKDGRSALFFHNYYRMSLEDYKEKIHGLLESKENVYDHMIKDMYYNGLVLERKYALLGFAYTLFLLAIILSVASYVVATFI